MRGNRRTDTAPERRLRSALHSLGYRFRKDHAINLGQSRKPRPDIAFTRQKVAVFIDGCYWHVCPEHGRIPGGVNREYWERKLEGNKKRDQADTNALIAAGWEVLRIWEHESESQAARMVIELLEEGSRR